MPSIIYETKLEEQFNLRAQINKVEKALEAFKPVQLEFRGDDKTGELTCTALFYKNSDVDFAKVPDQVGFFKIKPAYGRMIAVA